MSGAARLSTARLTIFASPEYAIKVASYPLLTVLPAIYAQNTTLTLAAVGTIIFAMRLVDAVTDPMVGHLSDKINTRWGRRKPWMVVGALLSVPAVYFLYIPPPTAGALYLCLWMGLFYVSWTMMEIPFKSWGAEITRDYRERSKVVTIRSMVGTAGGITFLAIPLLPFFETTEITAEVLEVAAYIVMILLPILIMVTVFLVPQGAPTLIAKDSLFGFLKDAARSGPFRIYLFATIIGFVGLGMNATLLYVFISFYLGIPEYFPHLVIIETAGSLLFMPVWLWVSNRIGKHKSWALSFVMPITYMPFMLLIEPGANAFWSYAPLGFLNGAAQAALFFLPTSILGDVSDYSTWKTKSDRAGKFFSSYLLSFKFAFALAALLSFNILDLVGFELAGENSSTAVLGLKAAFVGAPVLCYLLGVLVILRYPITQRRHAAIRQRIERRTRLPQASGTHEVS